MRHCSCFTEEDILSAADAVLQDPDWPAPLLSDLFDVPVLSDSGSESDVSVSEPTFNLLDYVLGEADVEVVDCEESDLRCYEQISDFDWSEDEKDESGSEVGEECSSCKSLTLNASEPQLCAVHYMQMLAREVGKWVYIAWIARCSS